MDILITGSNGYLARQLANSLQGHNIHSLNRQNNTKEFFRKCSPDIIIHTICNYGRNNESISEIYNSNLITGIKLLEEVSKMKKTVTFINCGTSLDKDINLYSFTKTQLVEFGKFISSSKIKFINMNLQHFYGPDAPNNFISFLIYECNRNHTIPLTVGTQKRDFIYIEDVCNAFLTVIENRNKLENFISIDVGTGVSISIKEVAEKVKKMTNSKSFLEFGKVNLRDEEKKEMKADIQKLLELGWKPTIDMDQGLNLIKYFFQGNKKENRLRQAIILKLALKEANINPDLCQIKIDHNNGISYVNGVKLPIIFPKEYFNLAKKLRKTKKEYNFYFNGFIGNDKSRKKLLHPFSNRDDTKIIWTNEGRTISKKFSFNTEYFSDLSNSNYGLCPHQLNWEGNKNTLWTYRYIECLMSYVIPVNFKKTPLGQTFIGNSYFVWDDEILRKPHTITKSKLEHNFNYALGKFTLNTAQIRSIKRKIK